LQAATYSNYSQARRRFADGTMRPLWRNLCGSLERILNVPSGAQLWYDDRDIPALKEDIQDKAQERRENAIAANNLVSAGYTR
jgi:phage portal protein BeeE